jgi:hypothetical protein
LANCDVLNMMHHVFVFFANKAMVSEALFVLARE